MPQQKSEEQQELRSAADDLAALGFGNDEIAALKRQGFVSHESRGGHVIYKLRFRLHGRQRVRYFGADAERAEQVERLLERLQRGRRIKKQLRDIRHYASKELRETKLRLKPFVENAGLIFHGLAIRRPRRVAGDTKNTVVIEKET